MADTTKSGGGLLHTALLERHRSAGGKIVPFAGWEMPIQYTSIVEEHLAVRTRAGIFDVSHMGEIEFRGSDRIAEVNRITTAGIKEDEPGTVQYALLLNERGGIIDDILVYVLDDSVILVVNAANRSKDFEWLKGEARGDVEVVDRSMETSQIAVQGPASKDILESICGDEIADLQYYRSVIAEVAGVRSVVSRTGYTGEFGYEIYAPWEDGVAVWDACMEAGARHGLVPVGLAARDSLRMEMAYSLYGNEISEEINPVEAGLTWVVRGKKCDWIGKEMYKTVKKEGPDKRLLGFRLGPRAIPRPGYAILHGEERVGAITSGGFSPSCGSGIGLGYVRADRAGEDSGFVVQIRKRAAEAKLLRGSFVASSVKGDEEESK